MLQPFLRKLVIAAAALPSPLSHSPPATRRADAGRGGRRRRDPTPRRALSSARSRSASTSRWSSTCRATPATSSSPTRSSPTRSSARRAASTSPASPSASRTSSSSIAPAQQIVSLELEVERDTSTLVAHASAASSPIPTSTSRSSATTSSSPAPSGTPPTPRKAQDIANIFANGGAQAQPAGGVVRRRRRHRRQHRRPRQRAADQLGRQPADHRGRGPGPAQGHRRRGPAQHRQAARHRLERRRSASAGICRRASRTSNPVRRRRQARCPTTRPRRLRQSATASTCNSLDGDAHAPSSRPASIQHARRADADRDLRRIGELPRRRRVPGADRPRLRRQRHHRVQAVRRRPRPSPRSSCPRAASACASRPRSPSCRTEGAITLGDISLPVLKVRRAETTLELPSGGSMVLGGLLQDNVRQSIGALARPRQAAGPRHALPQPRLPAQRDRARHHRHALSRQAGARARRSPRPTRASRRRATRRQSSSATSTASTAPRASRRPTGTYQGTSASSIE